MSGSALVASLLLAYAGMLGLCLGKERHWKQLAHPSLPAWCCRLCMPIGCSLLGLAVYAAGSVWPGGMALVGWLGLVSLAGFTLLLLLPFAPRLAMGLPLAGSALWVIAVLM